MPITTALLLKLAASAGTATLSKLLENDEGGPAQALNSVFGGVATNFIHQYTDKLDYNALSSFVSKEGGGHYKELNHDIEKLMLGSVPKTFKLLKKTYQREFDTEKDTLKFFDHLEKQATEKPNDEKDYELMEKSQTDWLDKNTNYAWKFAELFAKQEGIDLDQIYAQHIRDFLAEHFDKAYDVVFTEGLKDDKNEKPLKAFMIKSLRGIESQTMVLEEGQTQILNAIKAINENPKYIKQSQSFFTKEYIDKKEAFDRYVEESFEFLKEKATETGDDVKKIKEGLETGKYFDGNKYPKTLTAAPPKIDLTKYVERGTFLEDLHKDLEVGNNALLLNGLGGVGKSTLAAVYIQKYGKEYDHIAWLSQTDTFENMLLSAKILHDSLKLSMEVIDAQNLAPTIFNAMKKVTGKKLLVLDNVDESLKDFKSILPSDYRLLLTSREKIGLGFTEIVVGKLNLKEAKELIEKHLLKTTPTENEIEAFCELVDYHALSIELLIKTLEESFELGSLSELINYLKTNQLNAEVLQEEVFTNHSKEEVAVYAHLIQSFTLAKLEKKEVWILLQFAVLPPLSHQYKDLVEWLNFEGDGKKVFSNDLKNLAKKGWLEREGNSFSMHRMVQTLVKYQEKPDEENTKELVETFSKKLSIDQEKDNPIEKFQWIEYGKFIYESRETDSLHEKISVLANNLALVLQALGDYQGAKLLLEKALKSDEANYGEKHPTTAISYSNLALVLQALGDYQGAKLLLEKALKSDEANYGEKHPTTAISYSNLALVLKALGDYQEAKLLLEKALKSDESNYGEKHPSTARTQSNLATVLQALGDYQGAKLLLEKALKSDEANYGEKHPTTAILYHNYGTLLDAMNEPCEGLKWCQKAHKIFNEHLGESHPNTQTVKSWVDILIEKCKQ